MTINRASRNLSSQIANAKADGHIAPKEVAKFSPALLKDLAASPDGAATLEKAVANLEALANAIEAGTFTSDEPRMGRDSQNAGLRSVAYLLTALTDAQAELDEKGSRFFELAFGLAFRDGKVTVDEGRDLKKLAQQLIADADDPVAVTQAIRQAVGFYEAKRFTGMGMYTDRDAAPYFSDSSKAQMERMHRMLGKEILARIDDVAPGKIDPETPAMKKIIDVMSGGNPWRIFEVQHMIESELATYDTRGLSGPAKGKMQEAAASHARALTDYLATNYPQQEGAVQFAASMAWAMSTGHMYPPGGLNDFKASLAAQDIGDLRQTRDGYQDMGEHIGEPHSSASENLKAAYKEAARLAVKELRSRS